MSAIADGAKEFFSTKVKCEWWIISLRMVGNSKFFNNHDANSGMVFLNKTLIQFNIFVIRIQQYDQLPNFNKKRSQYYCISIRYGYLYLSDNQLGQLAGRKISGHNQFHTFTADQFKECNKNCSGLNKICAQAGDYIGESGNLSRTNPAEMNRIGQAKQARWYGRPKIFLERFDVSRPCFLIIENFQFFNIERQIQFIET